MKRLLIVLIFMINISISAQKKVIIDSLVISTVNNHFLTKITNFKNLKLQKTLDSLKKVDKVDIFIIHMHARKNDVNFIDSRYFYDSNKYSKDYINNLNNKKSKLYNKNNYKI